MAIGRNIDGHSLYKYSIPRRSIKGRIRIGHENRCRVKLLLCIIHIFKICNPRVYDQ